MVKFLFSNVSKSKPGNSETGTGWVRSGLQNLFSKSDFGRSGAGASTGARRVRAPYGPNGHTHRGVYIWTSVAVGENHVFVAVTCTRPTHVHLIFSFPGLQPRLLCPLINMLRLSANWIIDPDLTG